MLQLAKVKNFWYNINMISKEQINDLAEIIFKLEQEAQLGKDVQENLEKIEVIVSSLNFEDMILLDEYITEKFLTN